MKKININTIIQGDTTELSIYGKKIEIPSLGLTLKKYIPFEEKFGLANILFNLLYNKETNIYDGVNAIAFVPVFFVQHYCDDLKFPEDMEDLDVTGIYDYLKSSGAMKEILELLGDEVSEVELIIHELIKINKDKNNSTNMILKLIKDISIKTPEDINAMSKQVEILMKNKDVKDMIKFKDLHNGE